MTRRIDIHNAARAFLCLALLGAGVTGWRHAFAADPAGKPDRRALSELGDDFVSKIGGSMDEADLYLSGAGEIELAERKAKTVLPDDEPLLLRPVFGKDEISGAQDIYSIKHKKRLLMSLGDFASATGLAVTAKPSEGTAAGWFIRQTNTFSLDAKKREAVIQGKVFRINPDDMIADENDILISSVLLERWFGADFSYDFANLSLGIKTLKPFPVEEAYARSQKQRGATFGDSPPRLPYQAQPYALLSLPYIDTNINTRIQHSPGSAAFKSGTWSTILQGDLAGLNAEAFIGGTQRKPYINNARFKFGKQDQDGNLLGPLHATAYSFGDVDVLSQPLIGSGGQEQGISVTSQRLDNRTYQTTTRLQGNGQPGWDVELYRNDSFIDIRHIDETGFYDFGQVDLIVGDNDFKFVFYGPQGEIEEKHKHVGVDPRTLADQEGHYYVTATRNDLTTWQRERPTAPGTGDPHIAANYEYGIGGLGTANFGIESNSSDDGTYRTLAQGGLASYAFGTFFNADLGFDTEDYSFGGVLTARRTFDRQSLLLQYSFNSPEFNVSTPLEGASQKDSYRATLSGPVPLDWSMFKNTNYNVSATYNNFYSGANQTILSSGLTTRLRSVVLSTGSQYSRTESGSGQVNEAASGRVDARGFAYGGSWRIGGDYQTMPETRLNSIDVEYNRTINETIDMTAQLEHLIDPSFTMVSFGVNWQTAVATISPSVQVDSDQNVIGAVNVHFSAAADPISNRYGIYNKYLAGTGGIAARIFMDKNGNGVYEEGDELLPDVQIRALQGQRTAVSDKNGIAFIPDLEQNRLTDIVVNPASSEDLYGISLFEGVSVRPHPGAVMKLDFPIVEGGEMDGQADYAGPGGGRRPARNAKISLVAPDGTVEKTTVAASDGYWSISTIRPGTYYLTAEADDPPGYVMPRLVTFRPDGSTYFGQAVLLKPRRNVAFSFRSDNPAPGGPRKARVVRANDIQDQRMLLAMGQFHSRLALALAWYKMKIAKAKEIAFFDLGQPIAKIKPDPKTGEMVLILKPKKPMTLAQAATACEKLQEEKTSCTVRVITTYRNTPSGEEQADFEIAGTYPARKIEIIAEPEPAKPAPANDSKQDEPAERVKAGTTEEKVASTQQAAKGAIVVINLGSYNSRTLMSVMWYKFRTRYHDAIGNAHLLARPSETLLSAESGKYELRAAVPGNDRAEAEKRCGLLEKQGQACKVEIVPGPQEFSAAASPAKG